MIIVAHAINVGIQTNVLIRTAGGKAQQRRNSLALPEILDHAFLEYAAESGAEGLPVFTALLGQLFDQIQRTLDQRGTNPVEQRVVLQNLARDIERQISRVDHA